METKTSSAEGPPLSKPVGKALKPNKALEAGAALQMELHLHPQPGVQGLERLQPAAAAAAWRRRRPTTRQLPLWARPKPISASRPAFAPVSAGTRQQPHLWRRPHRTPPCHPVAATGRHGRAAPAQCACPASPCPGQLGSLGTERPPQAVARLLTLISAPCSLRSKDAVDVDSFLVEHQVTGQRVLGKDTGAPCSRKLAALPAQAGPSGATPHAALLLTAKLVWGRPCCGWMSRRPAC